MRRCRIAAELPTNVHFEHEKSKRPKETDLWMNIVVVFKLLIENYLRFADMRDGSWKCSRHDFNSISNSEKNEKFPLQLS